MSTMVNKST